jgi:hypothetical protein
VSDHLQCRNGVYYYRRRVPLHLVAQFGKNSCSFRCTRRVLKKQKKKHDPRSRMGRQFETYSNPSNGGAGPAVQTSALAQPLSENELIQLVRDYVERRDQLARKREVTDYPENPAQRADARPIRKPRASFSLFGV